MSELAAAASTTENDATIPTAATFDAMSESSNKIKHGSASDYTFKTCPEEDIEMMRGRLENWQATHLNSSQTSNHIGNIDNGKVVGDKEEEEEEDRPTKMVVLVLPGSFNPIHKGHLQCLEIARRHLESKV